MTRAVNHLSKDERERLNRVSNTWSYDEGINGLMIRHSSKVFARHFTGKRCLEMGPAEGLTTPSLLAHFDHVTALEGSEFYSEQLRNQFPTLQVENQLFEEYSPTESFDTIILGHVLEHVEDPVAIVSLASTWLAPGGRMISAVPNKRSLHRQLGVMMGALEAEDALNDGDRAIGHRRVFGPEEFRACFTRAGLRVNFFGGYFMKMISNSQMESTWPSDAIQAAMQLGERYPNIAADIYVVAGTD